MIIKFVTPQLAREKFSGLVVKYSKRRAKSFNYDEGHDHFGFMLQDIDASAHVAIKNDRMEVWINPHTHITSISLIKKMLKFMEEVEHDCKV